MVTAIITHGLAFLAGGIFGLLFARRNKNKVAQFYNAVDQAKSTLPK